MTVNVTVTVKGMGRVHLRLETQYLADIIFWMGIRKGQTCRERKTASSKQMSLMMAVKLS